MLTESPQQSQDFAAHCLKQYPNVKIWLLYGNLASGKTTFTKGLAKTMGLDPKKIKSPTFTYVQEYEKLIHYDLYRLKEMDESLAELLKEHLHSNKHILIEWPEVAEDLIQVPHLKIHFQHKGENQREIKVLSIPPQ